MPSQVAKLSLQGGPRDDEAETGVKWPQVQGCQLTPEAGRDRKAPPLEPSGELTNLQPRCLGTGAASPEPSQQATWKETEGPGHGPWSRLAGPASTSGYHPGLPRGGLDAPGPEDCGVRAGLPASRPCREATSQPLSPATQHPQNQQPRQTRTSTGHSPGPGAQGVDGWRTMG